MIYWTLSDPADGEILATGTSLTTAQAYAQGGAGCSAGVAGSEGLITLVDTDPGSQRIDTGTNDVIDRDGMAITPNKTSFTANGTDYVQLSGIPSGARISITMPPDQGFAPVTRVLIPDGLAKITTTVAGIYVVTIDHFPDQDYVVTLNAV